MSIFPTKILLAIDGSKEATLAARTAADIASKTGSELHVVHARLMLPWADYSTAGAPTSNPVDAEEARERLMRWLDDQVKQIEAEGGNVAQAYLRLGRPEEGIVTVAEEIVSLAEEIGAGLIAIGSRGLGGIRRALMGSVSDPVVRHAHCPVMVVRGESQEERAAKIFPTKVLLAIDGSEESELAARTAADLADKTRSDLHVVFVGPSTGDIGMGTPQIADIPAPAQEELDEEARRLLDAEVEQVKAAGGTVAQAHLQTGRPDAEIVALAEEIGAGLIAIGSRGLGGVRRALMGSVSDSVVRHAHCPVLVTRKEEPYREEPDQDMFLT